MPPKQVNADLLVRTGAVCRVSVAKRYDTPDRFDTVFVLPLECTRIIRVNEILADGVWGCEGTAGLQELGELLASDEVVEALLFWRGDGGRGGEYGIYGR